MFSRLPWFAHSHPVQAEEGTVTSHLKIFTKLSNNIFSSSKYNLINSSCCHKTNGLQYTYNLFTIDYNSVSVHTLLNRSASVYDFNSAGVQAFTRHQWPLGSWSLIVADSKNTTRYLVNEGLQPKWRPSPLYWHHNSICNVVSSPSFQCGHESTFRRIPIVSKR